MPTIGFAGFDSWKSCFLSFNYLASSIKMILPSGQGFHKEKTFQNSIKKDVCRFQKCLANRALKEASDGTSTMSCGRLFWFFYSSWKEWEFVVVCRGRIKQLYMPNYVTTCAHLRFWNEILVLNIYFSKTIIKHVHHKQSIPFPP